MRLKQIYKYAQEKRLRKAVSLAGPRYTPKLNVAVTIASVFDGLGRTRAFYDQLKRPGNDLLKNLRSVHEDEVKKIAAKDFEDVKAICLGLAKLLFKIPLTGVSKIDFAQISARAEKARAALSQCMRLLHEAEAVERKLWEQENQKTKSTKKEQYRHSYDEKFRNERHYLYEISGNLSALLELAKSDAALAANNPKVLLNGIAGCGKTHFLCDLATHRLSFGLPTITFLGEEFGTKNPWNTVKAFLNIDTTEDRFLFELNKYAAAKRTRALIIVDAVNESMAKPNWAQFTKLKKYKHIAIVLSVRSGFEQSDIPRSVLDSYVHVEHQGFAEREWEAVTRFFAEYKLPLPEVPILFPEFRVPLFLKIFCESCAGAKQPIKGHFGFTHIFEQYVKRQGVALLKRLGETANLGASHTRIWDGTIKEIAMHMGENGADRIPQKQAISIAAKQFPSRGTTALGLLEKFWLITRVPRYKRNKVVGFDYRLEVAPQI